MAVDLTGKKEKLLHVLKLKGPLLPIEASKEIGMDTMFTGAMLSELASNKKVKITTVKIGGSPLYYVEGQESKLQDLMKHLNSKDKEVAERLKSEKVIRDIECKPLERVSLRQLKDYAVPIRVSNNNEIETFWRWYVYDEEEAKKKIMELFSPKIEEPELEEEIKEEPAQEKQTALEIKKEEPGEEVKEEEIKIKQVKPKKERKLSPKEEKPQKEQLSFEDRVLEFFNKNNIEVVEEKLIKKNNEMNYLSRVSSSIGKLDYFIKVKNKSRVSEADLSIAFNEAGKMPLLFVSNGSLTKKAEEHLNSILKGVIFKKI